MYIPNLYKAYEYHLRLEIPLPRNRSDLPPTGGGDVTAVTAINKALGSRGL